MSIKNLELHIFTHMRKILLMAAALLAFNLPAYAQDDTDEDLPVKGATATNKGGSKPEPTFDMDSYLAENATFTSKKKSPKTGLRTTVKFTIDEQGNATEAKVTRTSGNPDCDEAALRVVEGMPQWTPAIKGGRPIKAFQTLTIKLTQEINGDEDAEQEEKEERLREKKDKRQEEKEEREERNKEKREKREKPEKDEDDEE